MNFGLILSLSYVINEFIKPGSASIRCDGCQKSIIRLVGFSGSGIRTGCTSNIIHTALQTIRIFSGGVFNALISLISLGLIVSNALTASSKAGIATAKSAATLFFCSSTISASF